MGVKTEITGGLVLGYCMVGLGEIAILGTIGLGMYCAVTRCRNNYLQWREKDLNNPGSNGTALELEPTPV